MKRIETALQNFFFAPATPEPLAILRLLLSLVLLVQAAMVAPDFLELYGGDGILQASVVPGFREQWLPPLLSSTALIAAGSAYVLGLVFLLVGIQVNVAATVAWFFHYWLTGGHFTTYGVDTFSHIFLFYLAVFPSVGKEKSSYAKFGLRVIQLHLCVVYLSSGLEKAAGEQWQTGEVMWRALNLPIYNQADFTWVRNVPLLAKLSAWGTLFVEIGYPVFVWISRTRRLIVFATVALHLGIAVSLGLTSFSLVMAVLTLSAFGSPEVLKILPRRMFRRSSIPVNAGVEMTLCGIGNSPAH